MSTFATLARARLTHLGMTQTELARRLGYTQPATIHTYLTGEKEPGERMIYRWARALECSPRDLLPDEAPARQVSSVKKG